METVSAEETMIRQGYGTANDAVELCKKWRELYDKKSQMYEELFAAMKNAMETIKNLSEERQKLVLEIAMLRGKQNGN